MNLNKNYGFNEYNMIIQPYRIMGTDEYSNQHIIDMNDEKISHLKELFNRNFIKYIFSELIVENEQYKLVDKKIEVIPPKIANYIQATLKEIKTEYNGTLHWYLRMYEFNDSKFGVEIHLQNSKSYVCEDFDGLLKYLSDIGFN